MSHAVDCVFRVCMLMHVRMWQGLKMACCDIKVPIFAVLTAFQLLGLSFVNFFPTYVLSLNTAFFLFTLPRLRAYRCESACELIREKWFAVCLGQTDST